MNDCIIITSVIETTTKPLNYSNTRSIYSHQERFEQTLETIESVRKYMPSTEIILVECSPPSEYMKTLSEKVDYFYNLEFNEVVNNSPEKGKGEIILLLHAFSNLKKSYTNIYKITGRYILQPSFDISIWNSTDTITVCKAGSYGMKDSMHTFFYKIPTNYISELKECFDLYLQKTNNEAIENFLAKSLRNITFVDKIGILVRWASYNFTVVY
jgi:hypothetical protein